MKHESETIAAVELLRCSKKGLPMTLENRLQKARAEAFEARNRLRQLCRENSRIREDFNEQLHEWRLARMKHEILVGEIRKNNLLTYDLLLSARVSPIQ